MSTKVAPPRGTDITQHGSQFGSTSVSGGFNLQGNFTGLTINTTASARADYVGHYSYTSLQPVRAFVPRPALCNSIREQLHNTQSTIQQQGTLTLVVWGLGGAGKTQLVLDYFRRYQPEYKGTFWIQAGRKEALERDFIHIYQLLFDVRVAAGQGTVKADDAVQSVKNWFSRQQDRWLLVFDKADAIDDEQDGDYIDLRHFMPDSPKLHIIITTRSRTAKDMTPLDGVEVGEMDETQAIELFYRSSEVRDRSPDTTDEVKRIVKELGCLALAVSLAGTYVSRTPRLASDVKQYLPEYHQRRRELLSRKPEKLIHQYGESILTTWETSFRAIEHQSPGACRFLTLLAFLSADSLFVDLFTPDDDDDQHSSTGEPDAIWKVLVSAEKKLDRYQVEEYFNILQRYSLVQWKSEQKSYGMHKLVHTWVYERLEAAERDRYCFAGLQLVATATLIRRREPRDRLRLIPHAKAVFALFANTSEEMNGPLEDSLAQMDLIVRFLSRIGRSSEACEVARCIAMKRTRVFGKDHPDTITAMGDLVRTTSRLEHLGEAEMMQREVLEQRRRVLSEEHPRTRAVRERLIGLVSMKKRHTPAVRWLTRRVKGRLENNISRLRPSI